MRSGAAWTGRSASRSSDPFRRRPVPLIGARGELIALILSSSPAGTTENESPTVSQPPSRPRRSRAPRDPVSRPHISEWYGHRVFPLVDASPAAVRQQRSGRCPFLSETLAAATSCVKAENSSGVCTISASSNGPRQDWLVCPYRALDNNLLTAMVRRLYGLRTPCRC